MSWKILFIEQTHTVSFSHLECADCSRNLILILISNCSPGGILKRFIRVIFYRAIDNSQQFKWPQGVIVDRGFDFHGETSGITLIDI